MSKRITLNHYPGFFWMVLSFVFPCFLLLPYLIILLLYSNRILKTTKQAPSPGAAGSRLPKHRAPPERPGLTSLTPWGAGCVAPSLKGAAWPGREAPRGQGLMGHCPEAPNGAPGICESQPLPGVRSQCRWLKRPGRVGGEGLHQLLRAGPPCHPAGQELSLWPGSFLSR